jgi:hypothetical protein
MLDPLLIEAANLLEQIAHHGLDRDMRLATPNVDMDEEADKLETQALDLAMRINRQR